MIAYLNKTKADKDMDMDTTGHHVQGKSRKNINKRRKAEGVEMHCEYVIVIVIVNPDVNRNEWECEGLIIPVFIKKKRP